MTTVNKKMYQRKYKIVVHYLHANRMQIHSIFLFEDNTKLKSITNTIDQIQLNVGLVIFIHCYKDSFPKFVI